MVGRRNGAAAGAVCLHLFVFACGGETGVLIADLELIEIARFVSEPNDSSGPNGTPLMGAPVYPLLIGNTELTELWVADNSQKRVISWYKADAHPFIFVGSAGGPTAEFSAPVGIDADIDEGIWVADLIRANITKVAGREVVGRINVNEPPLGVVVRDTALWVLTASSTEDFSVYSLTGEWVGRFGEPPLNEPQLARYNQGVVSRGNPESSTCAAVVALSFLPIMRCYDDTGHLVWEVVAPGERLDHWIRDIRSGKRRTTDRFGYLDVAQTEGHVIGLYSGEKPTVTDGISTNIIHVYDVRSGRFIASYRLADPVKYIAASVNLFATVAYTPFPTIRVFGMRSGWELSR